MNNYSNITLEVNLNAVVENYLQLKNLSKNSICSAVVKANAYGLGVSQISKALNGAGCQDFFVATLDEGIELRQIFLEQNSGKPSPKIYVFNGVRNGDEKEFYYQNLIPVINDFYQLESWGNFASQIQQKLNAVLHFDTGMNRLGFDYKDAEKVRLAEHYKVLNVNYVMSHLACASAANHEMNILQLNRTKLLQKIFSDKKISFANSAGILNGVDYHFEMVRPGYYLYANNVVSLKAKILQIRYVSEDGYVGYNATKKVVKGSKLAVVPIGYADGYHRTLSNNSHGFLGDYKVPLVGIVSMDSCIFDVSEIPENLLNTESEIELIGKNISVDDVAKQAQTIGYEILASLGDRLNRI